MNFRSTLGIYSLLALCLFYIVMVGGGTYEQITITKVLVSEPPKSFAILHGDHKFTPVVFWVTLRPVTILLFLIVIAANWKATSLRRIVLAAFAIDVLITLSTFLYFAPEVGAMINEATDPNLPYRASTWYQLNYLRLGAFYLVGVLLLMALKRSARPELR